jgi:hypothetical protein
MPGGSEFRIGELRLGSPAAVPGVVRPRKFRRGARRHGRPDDLPNIAIYREVLLDAAGRGGGGWIAASRVPRRDDKGLAPLSLAQGELWLFQ